MLADGEWFMWIVIVVVIMVAIDRMRGKKPAFRLSNYDPGEKAGTFKVVGVDRKTKMDRVWQCEAASAANAKAKGELEGILVTSVERA